MKRTMRFWVIASVFCWATAYGQSMVGFYTQGAATSSVNQTASAAYSTAKTSVPLLYVMPDTTYAASCSLVGTTGYPSISIAKFTDRVEVTLSNGPLAVASGASEIDCIVTGSK
jgi:hypothetical protein